MPKTRAEPAVRHSSGMRFSAQFPWNLPEMLGRRASLTHDSARPIIPEAVEMTEAPDGNPVEDAGER